VIKMTATLKVRGPWWELSPYIRSREAFATAGALWAVEQTLPASEYGQLPPEYVESVQRADYVVYSYRTPIAWHITHTPDWAGTWVIPDVEYSATTTRHQHKIRSCLPENS
jgi:hypothetical protein